jgi:hypothetical protein
MADTAAEQRRAEASFVLAGADGREEQSGTGVAVIADDGLGVGPVTVAFLDAEAVRAADYRIEVDLWPAGRLTLTQLGRRFDTFVRELHRARNGARVAGLLAHGIELPEVFAGALLGDAPRPVELQVYATHVTVVPVDADPFQLPLGALTLVAAREDPPGVVLAVANERTVVGQLARHRDAFLHAVIGRRDAQARLLAGFTGQACFADGLAVPRPAVKGFDDLVRRVTAEGRAECATALLAACRGGEPRLGFAQLLDLEADVSQPATPLPENWASFLLVPVGRLVVLELLAGPSAATYVFLGEIESVDRDLQALHFRRGPLALGDEEAKVTPVNPYRLALRKLEPLRRLRAATRARLIHNEGWAAALAKALA